MKLYLIPALHKELENYAFAELEEFYYGGKP